MRFSPSSLPSPASPRFYRDSLPFHRNLLDSFQERLRRARLLGNAEDISLAQDLVVLAERRLRRAEALAAEEEAEALGRSK